MGQGPGVVGLPQVDEGGAEGDGDEAAADDDDEEDQAHSASDAKVSLGWVVRQKGDRLGRGRPFDEGIVVEGLLGGVEDFEAEVEEGGDEEVEGEVDEPAADVAQHDEVVGPPQSRDVVRAREVEGGEEGEDV